MGFFNNAAYTAIGYGLHELLDSKTKKEQIPPHKTLEDIIDDYAHAHDIWGRDEHFYQVLLQIADKFHDPYAR